MNNRARTKKKLEKNRRKLLHELLDTALDINGLDQRKQEYTGDKPTVFMYLSGHIAKVSVEVHTKGWRFNQYSDVRTEAYMNSSKGLRETIETLKSETPAVRAARESRS